MNESLLKIILDAPTLAVLAWFMFVVYPQQREMFKAMERRSRMVMLLMIAIPQISEALKTEMQEVLNEIDVTKE